MRKPTGYCLQCGVENKTLFCSTRCRRRNQRGRGESSRPCVTCGITIGPDRNSSARFCTEKCRIKNRQADPKFRSYRVQHARNQRASRKSAPGSFTRQEWLALLDFYGGVCLSCGSDTDISADHVVALANGGTNTLDNIQPLCRPCNSKKHVKTIDYRVIALKIGHK